MKYTAEGPRGQDSIAVDDAFSVKEMHALAAILDDLEDLIAASEAKSANGDFVKNDHAENQPQAPAQQGVSAPAVDEGVVRVSNPKPSVPSVPSVPLLPSSLSDSTSIPGIIPSPSTSLTLQELIAQKVANVPARYLKRREITLAWERLLPADRYNEKISYAALCEATAFSLNFNAKRRAQLLQAPDPVNMLAKEINRHCKRHFGFHLPIAFSFEFSSKGKLHVHGLAVLPDWRPDTLKTFRHALKLAGGMTKGLGSGRQVDLKELFDWKGWEEYRAKDVERTVAMLGTAKITYCSRELTRAAHEAYAAEYERQKLKRAGKPAIEIATATPQRRRTLSASGRHRAGRNRALRPSMSRTRLHPSRRTFQPLQLHRRSATGPP